MTRFRGIELPPAFLRAMPVGLVSQKELQGGQNKGPEPSLFRVCTIEISTVQHAEEKLLREILRLVSWIIARSFRSRVGKSLATVEKHSTPLAKATTSSLEALKAYSTGMKLLVSSGHVPAMPRDLCSSC
jgi:hypothetical protein